MTIHLDTNVAALLRLTDAPEAARLRTWIREGATLAISSIAWSEYLCGPLNRDDERLTRSLLGVPIAFTAVEAELAARLFNAGGRRRHSLPDCQIAAVAIHAGALLATRNRADFRRFEGAGLRLAELV